MRHHRLGRSEIKVSEICLGTMTWGTQNTTEEGHAQIDHAKAAGVNFMDTAEMYPVNPISAETCGDTETIIGAYLKNRQDRQDWIIATKIAGPSGILGPEGITPERLETQLDASLKRLETDYVDLYQLHWPNRGSYHFRQHWSYDPAKHPSTEATLDNMRAVSEKMAALQKSGKVREFGTSNETAWGMAQWLRISEETGGPRMQTIQNEYSLLCRLFDTDLAELSIREDVTLLGYSCLACGMLTGKYAGGTHIEPGSRMAINGSLSGRDTPAAWAATEAYVEIARKHGLDPTSMAIAWTLTRPFTTLPIIGATSVAQMQKSLDGAALELSDAVLAEINKAYRTHGLPY